MWEASTGKDLSANFSLQNYVEQGVLYSDRWCSRSLQRVLQV